MKLQILLTGADGLLGGALEPLLRQVGTVIAPDRKAFDLGRPDTVREAVEGIRPDLVVHLAAEARVDYCEENPEEALQINARGTAHLALACRRTGARIVLLSSDYVFDGSQRVPYREYQRPAPLNVYGQSKTEAERSVSATVPNFLIVRSSSLFGAGGRHFVGTILDAARKGRPLRVVDDQVQSPTWVGHLAPALARVAWSEICGILHLSGSGECSWFDFARAILDEAGLDAACEPISSRESGRPAPRPAYSVLSGDLAAESVGIRMPDWREGLAAYLAGEGA